MLSLDWLATVARSFDVELLRSPPPEKVTAGWDQHNRPQAGSPGTVSWK